LAEMNITKDLKALKFTLEPIDSIKLNPKNPRKNEETTEDIIASINAFGYCDPLIVRKANRTIIAGNNRYKALVKMGATVVPVIFKDLSEVDADVLMVTHNKLTEKTPWDFPKLADLFVEFDQLNVDMDLTGFKEDEIQSLILGPTNPGEEWQGMPEFEQEAQDAYKAVIVRFAAPDDYQDFATLVKQNLTDKTKSIWYPVRDQDQYNRNKTYANES